MSAKSPKNPNVTWIAIFKSDFTSKSFSHYVYSDDVFYWIKRSANTRVHIAKSTGNAYYMRDFSFFDKDLNKTNLFYYSKNDWKCTDVTELALDFFGSSCAIIVEDPSGVSKTLNLNGQRVQGNELSANLFFSVIIFLLKSLTPYKDWNDVSLRDNANYVDYYLQNQIPKELKDRVYDDLQVESVWYGK